MKLKKVLAKAYGQIFQLFSANVIKGFFGFLGTILVLRGWSTSDIGDMYILVGVMLLFQQFGDLGTGSSFIQIMSRSKADNESVIGPFLGFKMLVVSVLLLFFLAVCCIYFFVSPTQEIYGLAAICLAAILGVFGNFFTSLVTARQQFTKLSYLKITPPLIKTIIIGGLYLSGLTNFFWLLVAFITPNIVVFVLGFTFTKYPIWKGSVASIISKRGKQLYEMSRWVFIIGFFSAWFAQIDIFMLKRMSSDYQITLFVSAQRIAALVLLFSQAIFTVMLPKMKNFRSDKELLEVCKKIFVLYLVCLVAMIPGVYLSPYIVPIILGQKYVPAVPILKVFLFQTLGYMFIVSQSLIYYRKNRLPVLALLTSFQLGFNFVGNYFVIPEYKALGVVWVSTLLNNGFYFISLAYCVFLLTREKASLSQTN